MCVPHWVPESSGRSSSVSLCGSWFGKASCIGCLSLSSTLFTSQINCSHLKSLFQGLFWGTPYYDASSQGLQGPHPGQELVGSQVELGAPGGRVPSVSAHQGPGRLAVRPTSDARGGSTHSPVSHNAFHSLPAAGAARYPNDKSQEEPRAQVNISFHLQL